MLWVAEKRGCCGPRGLVGWGVWRSSVPVTRRWAGPWWAAVIPSPRQGRHDGVRDALVGGVNQEGRPRHQGGGHDTGDPRRAGWVGGSCGRPGVQGADMVITQRVVDVFDLPAGGGHHADVAA